MLVRLSVFILAATLLSFQSILAQYQRFESELGAGQMLPIYPHFPETDHHRSLAFSWMMSKPSPWNDRWHNPETGVLISYHDFGNDSILGTGLGLQYQMKLKQRLEKHFYLTQFFRFGGIYSNKAYHYIENTANIVSGSHYSFLIFAGLGFEFKVSDHFGFSLGGGMWHSSNGHTALPNVGVNTPMALFSASYTYPKRMQKRNHSYLPIDSLMQGLRPSFMFAIGTNENGSTIRPTNGEQYRKYLMAIGLQKRYRSIFRTSLSIEAYYDEAYRFWVESEELDSDEGSFLHASTLMLLFGHEFIYQRFGFILQGGLNIYNPTLDFLIRSNNSSGTVDWIKRYVPGRVAMRYYFLHPWKHQKSPFVQVAIKSNLGQADYLEFGLGINL